MFAKHLEPFGGLRFDSSAFFTGFLTQSTQSDIMKFNLSKYLKQANTKQDKNMIREESCWEGYEQIGMKDKDGKKVPNCVKKK